MDILLTVHSTVRWFILIVGLLAALKFAAGWLRQNQFAGMDRGLSAAFSGLIDLQALLGFIFLLWNGLAETGFPRRYRLEHAVIMIIVLVVAHLTARWKSSPDSIRFRNSFFVVVASLGLIVVGVTILPNGWSR